MSLSGDGGGELYIGRRGGERRRDEERRGREERGQREAEWKGENRWGGEGIFYTLVSKQHLTKCLIWGEFFLYGPKQQNTGGGQTPCYT